MPITMSCAFPPSMSTPDHVALAEELGYTRAWLYDSPGVYPDVWMILGMCAQRTTTIGLGPGVLIPSLRHPMVNAAAIATLAEVAGAERLAIGFGAGFSGRLAMGQRPLPWKFVAEYVRAVRGLLRGEIVEWEGAKIQMLHSPGFGADRPINVPILIGAGGPKGNAVAREVGDGLFIGAIPPILGWDWEPYLHFGTILDEDEDFSSPRVMDASGFGASIKYHVQLENGLPMADLPNGEEWAKIFDDVPKDERHLALHDRHLIEVSDRDRPFVTPEFLEKTSDAIEKSAGLGMVIRPAALREQVARMGEGGVTEIVYQPSGPDVPRELRAFAAAYHG